MLRLALVVTFSLLAGASLAQRPSTLNMSCGQARGLVAAHGAIVMTTGRHTYERFVASPRFCYLGEHARPGVAPTHDARQCRIGWVCQPGRPFWDEDDDFLFFD